MNIIRSNAEITVTRKEKSSKSSRGGIFRVKHSMMPRNKSLPPRPTINNNEVPKSLSQVPIEQSITWTLSEDSASPTKVSQKTDEPLEEESEQKTLVFTEQDLILNELNHIQALSNLEANVQLLKTTMDDLVAKHASEMERKDDEYVEILIKLGEKEEELAAVRAELSEAKKDLAIVSSTLVQTQHRYFEETHKSIFHAFMK